MSNEIRAMWPKFDALIEQAESADSKAVIAAIKLHAEMMNMRLAMIEANGAAQMRESARASAYPAKG